MGPSRFRVVFGNPFVWPSLVLYNLPVVRSVIQMKTLVSVVVPFYNEENNVLLLAEQIDGVLGALASYDYECLFVNDGSTDGTGANIDRVAQANPRIRPAHLPRNLGQSAALITGMRRARGVFILTLDGDLQNDPSDLPIVLELLESCDCVCGYRGNRRDPWARRASSWIANRARNLVLRDGVRDTGCGIKGFRRSCLEHFVPFNGQHRFFAVMVRRAGLSIREVEVSHRPRLHGVSKYGISNRLWRGIYDLFGVGWLSSRLVAVPPDEDR